MVDYLKFAAIDIGSNAVRLLLAGVFEFGDQPMFKKMSLTRMPIRLGADAFSLHRISDDRVNELVSAMVGFRYLIDSYGPIDYKACATSAMRGAENAAQICQRIRQACGIQVDILDGGREARLIFENQSAMRLGGFTSYLYVDVGGGSTEITLFAKQRAVVARSFDIGTIRLLQNQVSKADWGQMKTWLKTHVAPHDDIAAIGSGGNINKIFRLAECKNGRPMSLTKILKVRRLLNGLSFNQRISRLGLRPDRADVIVPAADVYLNVMHWAGIEDIFVPVVGLADGVVHILYNRFKALCVRPQQSEALCEQIPLWPNGQ